MPNPVRFSADLERLEPQEEDTAHELREVLLGIMTTTAKDYGHAVRSVHAKSHAILEGQLTVKPDLPDELAQGLFRHHAKYPIIMRISTIPGDVLDDHVSVPRGLAMKVMNVDGERLDGSEAARTQDFVMVDSPTFAAPTAAKFLGNLKLLAKTTDKAEWAKRGLSAVFRAVEKGFEAIGTKSPLITTLGGHPLTNPAGDTYYSQTPYRYGDFVAKYSLAPVSPNLTALTGLGMDISGQRDGLRDKLNRLFASEGGTWEFRVQLLNDLSTMPIEDASVAWPEESSPFVAVATVTVEPQQAWSETRAAVGDDQLAFSVWHGLEAHRPLGSINRVRKAAYQMSADFRATTNRCPIHEPGNTISLPS